MGSKCGFCGVVPLLLIMGASASVRGDGFLAAAEENNGPLDRLVSYFNSDLKNLDDELIRLKPLLNVSPMPSQQTNHWGYRSSDNASILTHKVGIDLGRPYQIDSIVLVPIDVPVDPERKGWGFPSQYRVEVSSNPDWKEPEVFANTLDKDSPNPGLNAVVIASPGTVSAQYVRVVVTKPWQMTNKQGLGVGQKLFALGEIMVLSGDLNVAAGLPKDKILIYDNDSADYQNFNRSFLVDGQSILGPPVIGSGGMNGYCSETAQSQDSPIWVQIDLMQDDLEIQEVRLFPAWSPDFPNFKSFGFPNKFKVEISDFANMANPKLIGEYNDRDSPAENVTTIRGNGSSGRFIRLTTTSPQGLNPGRRLVLAEMEVYASDENKALDKKVTASSSLEKDGYGAKYLVDGYTNRGKIVSWPTWFRNVDERKEAERKREVLIKERELKSKGLIETVIRAAGYVVAGLMILSIYLSFRSLLIKRRALEALRTRIARDIHDEIGSGLGTISLLSRMAQDGDLEDARQDLKEINNISVSMSEAMRDIVWFNRTDVDTVRDLLMRMRETAESMVAKQHRLQFETVGQELVRPISTERRREIFLVFKEALHNILKHAQASKVEVRAGLDGQDFVLRIRDDGKGFDKAKGTSGAGMGSMKKRAETLRGALTFETKPGEGTVLSLRAKLK